MSTENPECPECGGPIGVTSTYCMHCGADLEDRETRSVSTAVETTAGDGWTESTEDSGDATPPTAEAVGQATRQEGLPAEYQSSGGAADRTKLLPERFAIKAVTFLLAMAAGLAVLIGSMYVLSSIIAGWLTILVSVPLWLASTAAFLRLVPG